MFKHSLAHLVADDPHVGLAAILSSRCHLIILTEETSGIQLLCSGFLAARALTCDGYCCCSCACKWMLDVQLLMGGVFEC